MKDRYFLRYGLMAILMLLLSLSCKRVNNPLAPKAVGTPWELLVVMDKSQWEAPEGRALFEVLDEDVPGLPQSEPEFYISRCDKADFTGILKPVRNVLEIEISKIYSASKIKYMKDLWAEGQYVAKIVSPDTTSFIKFIRENPRLIYDFFEMGERERSLNYILPSHNREFSQKVYEQFGYKILVPKEMTMVKQADDFIWMSNGKSKKRQDMVIYTYPYVDVNTFTPAYLNAKRDSVMKINIPGGPEGSYMGTQEEYMPVFRSMSVRGKYAVEIRGLWEVKGDIMGGPFVSLTRLDEKNQRIVTAEVFVYAPEENKRNLIRHNEAALYSLELPGEFQEETKTSLEK